MRNLLTIQVLALTIGATLAAAPEPIAEPPVPLSTVRVVGATKTPPHTLVRLRAEGYGPGSTLVWRVHPRLGVDLATTAPEHLQFAAPPGAYDVELLAITHPGVGGPVHIESAKVTVTVEGCHGPMPPPVTPKQTPPPGKADPVGATGKLLWPMPPPHPPGAMSNCTATVMYPRRSDGKWDVLTASHCAGNPAASPRLTLKDGRTLALTMTARNPNADLCWLITDSAELADLPFALLAEKNPEVGTRVWQAGYGQITPTLRKDGVVSNSDTGGGMSIHTIAVSHGDSGGGIFRSDTGEWVGAVCCGDEVPGARPIYAGSVASARALRPK